MPGLRGMPGLTIAEESAPNARPTASVSLVALLSFLAAAGTGLCTETGEPSSNLFLSDTTLAGASAALFPFGEASRNRSGILFISGGGGRSGPRRFDGAPYVKLLCRCATEFFAVLSTADDDCSVSFPTGIGFCGRYGGNTGRLFTSAVVVLKDRRHGGLEPGGGGATRVG